MFDGIEAIEPDQEQLGRAPEATPEPKEEAKPKDDPLREIRDELKSLKRELSDTREDAKYWRNQATQRQEAPEPEPEPEPELNDVDLVEAITNNDAKALSAAMKKLGFVSRAEVEAEIQRRTNQLTDDAKLTGAYPELLDDDSEMFHRTAEIYQDLARDPDMKKSKRLMETAARQAAAELNIEPRSGQRDRASEPKRREQVEETDRGGDYEDEGERVSRVRSQMGSRGRQASRAAAEQDGGGEELSPIQKRIVASLRAAGANIDEDKYRARASKGVSMSGLPPARRGGKQ